MRYRVPSLLVLALLALFASEAPAALLAQSNELPIVYHAAAPLLPPPMLGSTDRVALMIELNDAPAVSGDVHVNGVADRSARNRAAQARLLPMLAALDAQILFRTSLVYNGIAVSVASLRAPDVLGANVTLPHKRPVLALLDRLEPAVETIGAANTIIREHDGTLTGANTDMPAVLATLREDAGYEPQGQTAVILGASGAARAAAVALVHAHVAQLLVVNRTLERAEELLADVLAAADADPLLFACTPDAIDVDVLREATLIINATSLGWHGNETPLPAALIPPDALVFDMVYRQTQLLRDAEACGARTLGGLGMLVRQAALAFERWTGAAPPIHVMYDAVEAHNRTHL